MNARRRVRARGRSHRVASSPRAQRGGRGNVHKDDLTGQRRRDGPIAAGRGALHGSNERRLDYSLALLTTSRESVIYFGFVLTHLFPYILILDFPFPIIMYCLFVFTYATLLPKQVN